MSFHIIYDDGVDNLVLLEESNYTTRIPMSVNVGDKEFRDKEALMKAMKTSKEPARTACPSIGHYIDAIEAHRDDDVYIVTLSSALSGSYNAAMNAVQICRESYSDIKAHVFDSLSATAGETRVALEVYTKAKENMAFDDIISHIEGFIKNYNTLFVIDNLTNLIKNGRLSKLEGQFISLAQIKFVGYASREGHIEVEQKAIGIESAYTKLLNELKVNIGDDDVVVISNCRAMERAVKLRKALEEIGITKIYMADAEIITTVYGNVGSVEVSW